MDDGHVGKINAIYDHEHYPTDEEIREYKNQFDEKAFRIYGITENVMKLAEQRASDANDRKRTRGKAERNP